MKRKNSTLLILFFLIFSGSIIIFFLYTYYINEILNSLELIPELMILIPIIFIKISVISIMGGFLLFRWYNQQEQYLSDISFMFGIFFIILIFGKLLDILINMLYYLISPDSILILVKIRFLLIISNIFPILFFSIEIILMYLSLYERFSALKIKNTSAKYRNRILILLLVLFSLVIILAPDYSTILTIYPLLMIPSFIMIVLMFLYAYRSKRLSEINPLIVAIGFFAFLLTTVFRAIGQNIIDPKFASILSEIFEIISFIIIFIGLIRKANYIRSEE
ncbi:MAG: hypothetical protein EU547_04270 [Promethearchaeota archaeon]|nr:MAG: hypothetical protein EU547_04270 [Candidatus Lokiarchaeota archaeon]